MDQIDFFIIDLIFQSNVDENEISIIFDHIYRPRAFTLSVVINKVEMF